MEYLWIWMSIKVLCRNPTFGGFIIWAKAQRIGLTFNSLHVHRRAFCQRALREYLKKLSQIEGRMSAFQIIFHATQVKRHPESCNVFSSLFYFSFLVIARLNGCYYVGGAGSKPAWLNKKCGKREGVPSRRAHFGCLFSVTAILLPL